MTPLILLPGMLCNEQQWAHQTAHLADTADVTVADLSHYDSMRGMAEAVLGLAPPQFALAGLSMGGIVAMEIMRLAPERVLKLALMDTNPYPSPPQQQDQFAHFRALIADGRFLDITKVTLKPNLLYDDNPALKQAVYHMAAQVGAAAYGRQMTAVATRADSRASLKHIHCPTLVLCGRYDIPCPVALHEEMAQSIPQATLVVIEQCGHLSSMEQPQAVTAVMRYWLAP